MNFAQFVATKYQTQSEAVVHRHAAIERAEWFRAVDGGSAELEVLNLINALAYMVKPNLVLETGTGKGLTTIALASAIQLNGFGHVDSVEIDLATRVEAGQNLARFSAGLVDWVTLHDGDSRDFIRQWSGPPFDFCLFDSLIEFRHEEFELLLTRGLLAPQATCVFHDTSRVRGEYYNDFNPTMIEALDEHSRNRQWLEFGLSRGLRIIKMG